MTQWTKAYWDAVHPFDLGGASTYGDNYARLAAVKKKYDPTNLFQVNQNIKPAT